MKEKIKKFVIGFVIINLIFFGWILLEERSVFGQELFFVISPVLIILFLIFRKEVKSWIFLSLIFETVLLLIVNKNQSAQNMANIIFLFFILLVFEKTWNFLHADSYED